MSRRHRVRRGGRGGRARTCRARARIHADAWPCTHRGLSMHARAARVVWRVGSAARHAGADVCARVLTCIGALLVRTTTARAAACSHAPRSQTPAPPRPCRPCSTCTRPTTSTCSTPFSCKPSSSSSQTPALYSWAGCTRRPQPPRTPPPPCPQPRPPRPLHPRAPACRCAVCVCAHSLQALAHSLAPLKAEALALICTSGPAQLGARRRGYPSGERAQRQAAPVH